MESIERRIQDKKTWQRGVWRVVKCFFGSGSESCDCVRTGPQGETEERGSGEKREAEVIPESGYIRNCTAKNELRKTAEEEGISAMAQNTR